MARRLSLTAFVVLCAVSSSIAARDRAQSIEPEMSSMSIVGYDPKTGEVGIALASRFFAVGPIAAHVRAGVGAIATMGSSPFKDATEMLDWMEQGATPEDVLARLRQRYDDIGQINIVDAKGQSVSTTSATSSSMWKGHKFGRNYAAAGNILAGPEVVDAFATTFERSENSEVPLAERLLAALDAADAAGGDARGRMGATLIVKRKGGGYAGTDDYVNLRVDDSTNSINELKSLYARWRDIRAQEPGFRILEQSRGDDVRWLQKALRDLGYLNAKAPGVFDGTGEPLGVLNDVTAEAIARFKGDRGLGGTPSAGLETIDALRKELGGRGQRQ
ncbi:MAG: DUF1028 domain-containing protein [Vicinamibacterales bacterium]